MQYYQQFLAGGQIEKLQKSDHIANTDCDVYRLTLRANGATGTPQQRMTATIWVGKRDRFPRKATTQAVGTAGTVTTTYAYADIGAHIAIAAPPLGKTTPLASNPAYEPPPSPSVKRP